MRGLLAGLCVATWAAPAGASDARVASLRGDPFQADETDVFRFPGLAPAYANTLLLELSPDPLDAYGTLLVNRPWTFGVSAHRPRAPYDDLAEMGVLYGWTLGGIAVDPVVDLIAGWGGGAHGIGLLLGLSAGLASSEDVAAGTGESSTSVLGFDLSVGHSADIPGYRGDSALALAFRRIEVGSDGERVAQSNAQPSFLLSHRSIIGPAQGVRIGVDASLTRRAYGLSASVGAGTPMVDTDLSRWLFRLTVGPNADVAPGIVLSGGIAFGYEWLGGETDGTKLDTLHGVMAPGVVASLEAEIFPFLVARAGVAYDLVWSSRTERDSAGDTTAKAESIRHGFSWSVGLGFRWRGFRLDGMVAPGLLTQGPEFLGGGNPGLFSQVSAALEF